MIFCLPSHQRLVSRRITHRTWNFVGSLNFVGPAAFWQRGRDMLSLSSRCRTRRQQHNNSSTKHQFCDSKNKQHEDEEHLHSSRMRNVLSRKIQAFIAGEEMKNDSNTDHNDEIYTNTSWLNIQQVPRNQLIPPTQLWVWLAKRLPPPQMSRISLPVRLYHQLP